MSKFTEVVSIAAAAATAAITTQAFVPVGSNAGSLRGNGHTNGIAVEADFADAARPVEVGSTTISTPSMLALGCVAAAAAGTAARSARNAAAKGSKSTTVSCKATGTAEPGTFAGGMIGGESAFGTFEYNFDPLGLAEKFPEQLPFFREAEIKHGRIAMLAWVGLVVPSFVRIPGPPECYDAPILEAALPCYQSGALLQVSILITILEACGGWAKITPTPYIPLTDGRSTEYLTMENAGDYRLGLNLLPADPEAAKQMKLKELKNGRLAMLAFGGAITQAAITGNDFPWLFSAEAPSEGSLVSGRRSEKGVLTGASRSKVVMRAKQLGGYEMSKSIPFLPKSPALEGYVGEEAGFDPMGFTYAVDIMFLREAELKHGRIAMLATAGWIATDLGFRLPGEAYQVSTIAAHEAMVKYGPMSQILLWVSLVEILGLLALTNMYEGTTDRKPGDFYLRKFYPEDEEGQKVMQMKELKNGRLAMLAYSGIVTVAVLTGKTWPFIGAVSDDEERAQSSGAFCGASMKNSSSRSASGAITTLRAESREGSKSLPFLPKPKNLAGYVGEEAEFDPLQFAEWYDIRWLRESELKHGRVAMMATVGFLAQPFVAFPGVSPEPNSVLAASTAPPELWGLLFFAAGWIESSVYDGKITQLDMFDGTDRVPGRLGFGTSRLDDMTDDESKLMQYKELKNGRLAMLAIGGMIAHNIVVGGPLFPLTPEGWSGPGPVSAPGFYP